MIIFMGSSKYSGRHHASDAFCGFSKPLSLPALLEICELCKSIRVLRHALLQGLELRHTVYVHILTLHGKAAVIDPCMGMPPYDMPWHGLTLCALARLQSKDAFIWLQQLHGQSAATRAPCAWLDAGGSMRRQHQSFCRRGRFSGPPHKDRLGPHQFAAVSSGPAPAGAIMKGASEARR